MSATNTFTVPSAKSFYVTERMQRQLVAVAKMTKAGANVNVLVTGRQGCGKSDLAEQFAASTNRPFATVQIGLLAEVGQLFGQQTLVDGNVSYQSFSFADAIQTDGCVVLLDELNRAENPKAMNDIYSVLDHRRSIWLDEAKKSVTVAKGVVFFATINQGLEFTGTDQLDAALADRFSYTIAMPYLPAKVEKQLLMSRVGLSDADADGIAKVVTSARASSNDVHISTRKVLDIGQLVKAGMSLRDSLTFALSLDANVLENMLLGLHLNSADADEAIDEGAWITLS